MADGAERYLASMDGGGSAAGFDLAAFAALSAEIRVRLLTRAINRIGHEGPAELGKVEALLEAIDQDGPGPKSGRKSGRVKQTLAGAVIGIAKGRISSSRPRRDGGGWVGCLNHC
jgi:tRNA(Ile)-lysidine synthase